MALHPTPNERSYLQFLIGKGGFWVRYLLAGLFFTVGFACLVLLGSPLMGAPLILLGHLPLWVRSRALAPAPVAATVDEEVWTPTDADWYSRFERLWTAGREWDLSFWDLSSPLCLVSMLALGAVLLLVGVGAGSFAQPEQMARLLMAFGLLFGPIYLNGMRSPWNPFQLQIKGKALQGVAEAAENEAPGRYDAVPLLALREGKKGRFPVDARIMLRPKVDDGKGFLGVQVQVCLNNVRGTNYPYVYAVILGKPSFRLPRKGPEPWVFEPDVRDGVSYVVVRQHADRRSGWHTPPGTVQALVITAVRMAEKARKANGG